MNRGAMIFLGLLFAAAILSVYFLVPSIHDGSFPGQTNAERFFRKNQDALDALYEQLKVDDLSRVTCYPDLVRAGTEPKGAGQELTGDSLAAYLPLCRDAQVSMGWRIEDGYLFYLGGSTNDVWDFNIALIRRENEGSLTNDCETTEPAGDFGKCQFSLSPDWSLDYEWMSKSYIDSFSDEAT